MMNQMKDDQSDIKEGNTANKSTTKGVIKGENEKLRKIRNEIKKKSVGIYSRIDGEREREM